MMRVIGRLEDPVEPLEIIEPPEPQWNII